MNEYLASIVIVNYCGKKLLKPCLDSILTNTELSYEIIIVDNNSDDGSIEFLEKNYPNVKIIKLNKNYGFALPNNIAAKVAKGKFLAFLNNDTTVTPNWLSELVHAVQNDKKIIMAQSLLLHPDGSVDSSGDFIDNLGRAYSNHDKPQKIRYILSPRAASMIIRKDAFLDLGGFDEDYFASFEDVDLGWRSWLWGYKAIVVPTSIVYHTGRQTVEKISNTIAFHGIKNNIFLRMTNFDFPDAVRSIFLMGIILLANKIFGVSLITNIDQRLKIPDLKTIFQASFWILKNLNKIAKKRRLIVSRKTITNKELKKMGLIVSYKE